MAAGGGHGLQRPGNRRCQQDLPQNPAGTRVPGGVEEPAQAVGMVVVAVGKDGDIYGRKIDAKRGGVFGKQIALSHIKKNLMLFSFYI